MPLILLTQPEEEPLALADIKAFLRLDTDDEDDLLSRLIIAARRHVEAAAGKKLVTQTWRLVLDQWPQSGVVSLPLSPMVAVTAARLRAVDGSSVTLDATSWVLDCAGRLHTAHGPPVLRPFGGIEIDVEVGFGGPSAVPADLVQAMRFMVAYWFEHRSGCPDESLAMPAASAALIAPERRLRL
jgi:uncharacterized phiE125 gp8 family phage protein